MSRNEDFNNGIWSDPEFEELSPAASWLYIWSWTNPRCDWSGLYKVGKRSMTESKVSYGDLDGALDELAEAGWAFYEDGVLWVCARVKHIRSKSSRMAISVARDAARIGREHPLLLRWLERYANDPWLRNAISEVFEDLTNTSGEVHVTADDVGESVNHTKGSDEPSQRFSRTGTGTGVKARRGRAAVARDELPELPEPLATVASLVVETLGRVAAHKGSKAIRLAAVGRVLADFPEHDHRRLVGEFEHYWCFGAGAQTKRPDIVLTYRRRLAMVTPGQAASNGPARLSEREFAEAMNAGR